MSAEHLEKLAEISRFYGANPEYIVAGGGNTSFKDDDFLYIKASGTSLAHAKPEDFVKMNRPALAAIWEKSYPADTDAREAAVLADMMASRAPGEQSKRPSVETLLHDLLPFAYVVHTHPALVNGLTCSQQGQAAAKRLFPQALWIPLINPGYILSRAVKDGLALEENGILKTRITAKGYSAAPGSKVIFLQNHGVFVAANTTEEIRGIYDKIMEVLEGCVKTKPDFSGETASFGNSQALEKEIVNIVQKEDLSRLKNASHPAETGNKWFVRFVRNNQIAAFTRDEESFKPVCSAFTPDHIVYSGSDPLFVKEGSNFGQSFKAHVAKTKKNPKIAAVQSLGVFGLGDSENAVLNSLELFRDTMKIAVYSDSFGGQRFMTDDMIRFINNWEVERYRSQVAVK